MQTKVRRWGNFLVTRIPRSLARGANLQEGSAVNASRVDGKIVIAPTAESGLRLAALLSQVTDDNIHPEVPL
jgi:antitoxin component of MazEF toxin-antitoxin module